MKIIFSLGGSILTSHNKNKSLLGQKIKDYSLVFKQIKDMGNKVGIVVGGGNIAREYISVVKKFSNQAFCDEVGIMATRMNASLLISALGNYCYKDIPVDFKEIEKVIETGKIFVMGGTHPGHTTDAVGALLAEYIDADLFVIVTNVDGVYDKDPNKYNNAKKIDKMTSEDLLNLIMKSFSLTAGSKCVIDLLAAQIINRSKIKTIVINGKDPQEILRIITKKHEYHNGTIIQG